MKRLAVLAMFIALFVQGLMPALAMPMPQEKTHEMATDDGDHGQHHAAVNTRTSTQPKSQSGWQCPLLPAGCALGLCIACTALPAVLPAMPARAVLNGYPDPAPATPLLAALSAPLVPPPRM